MRKSDYTVVYMHYDPDDFDNPVYYGIGTPDRPYNIRSRGKRHKNWIESLGTKEYVEILHWCETRAEAEFIETGLIRDYDPTYNIQKRVRD